MGDETMTPTPTEPTPPAETSTPFVTPAAGDKTLTERTRYGTTAKGFAIASLVCSLVGLISWPSAIVGVIFGFFALNRMQGTTRDGDGTAKAGIIIGFCIIALYLVCLVIYGAMLFATFANSFHS
jgi:uncharacterized membrane protein